MSFYLCKSGLAFMKKDPSVRNSCKLWTKYKKAAI